MLRLLQPKHKYNIIITSRQWYMKFYEFMIKKNFIRSKYYSCVYFETLKDGIEIHLLLYVNDMMIVCSSKAKNDKLKKKLNNAFVIKNLGPTRKILGIKLKRNKVKDQYFYHNRSISRELWRKLGCKIPNHL